MVKIVDLSLPLSSRGHLKDKPIIEYLSHEQFAEGVLEKHGLQKSDLRDGHTASMERLTLTSHATTHLDAPYHFGPTSGGKPAKTIDQVPLEWCYADGVVLDFHHKKKGEGISTKEVQEALDKIAYRLNPFDIVLIRTDVYKYVFEEGYENMHPGMTAEATLWLINQGIKVMGIDAWGWDRPLDVMVKELKEGNSDQYWEAHYVGREAEYCHMERLANLDQLPEPFGFKVSAFPIKIEGASGGWVRAVAIFEE
jgi:kynurenine formamidase